MRRILVLLFSSFFALSILATPVSLRLRPKLGDIDDGPIGHSIPKAPLRPITVYIDGFVLTFPESHPECTVRLVNSEGIAYEESVSETTNSISLPGTLSGEYTIQLLLGNWIFEGEIEL